MKRVRSKSEEIIHPPKKEIKKKGHEKEKGVVREVKDTLDAIQLAYLESFWK